MSLDARWVQPDAAQERFCRGGQVIQRVPACAEKEPGSCVTWLMTQQRFEEPDRGLRAASLQLRQRVRVGQALLLREGRRPNNVLTA